MDAPAFFVHELTRHQRALCSYICLLTGNLSDAEEVLQGVNVRLWEQKDAYDQERPFLPWARTIAHYHVLAFRTRKRRERLDFNNELVETLAAEAIEMQDELEVRHVLLERCLEKVGRAGRELLDMCYAGGLAIKTAAARLGRSEAATYKAVARLRCRLHDCVEANLSERRVG